MLFKVAWRNLWRNKRRSLIVSASIIIGLAMLMIFDGLTQGMIYQMLYNQVNLNIGHIQVHKNGFREDKVLQNSISDPEEVESVLKKDKSVINYAKRIKAFGLVQSPGNSAGAVIFAVQPEKEQEISEIDDYIIEGEFPHAGKNEILIGKKMAEKLEVEPGDKVVAIASGLDSTVNSELFRVSGIYRSSSSEFDRSFVYIPLKKAQKMLSLVNRISEFALVTNDIKHTKHIRDELRKQLGSKYEAYNYEDILPMLVEYVAQYQSFIIVFYLIIGLAVIFGIINTMLMSVFERIGEIGVLMSIGMKNSKIFLMIIQEAFALGVIGTIVGFAIGVPVIFYLKAHGIDLSIFSESLSSFGVNNVIYPEFGMDIVINSAVTMPLMAVLGALYPAYKAVKLQPVNAMRHV